MQVGVDRGDKDIEDRGDRHRRLLEERAELVAVAIAPGGGIEAEREPDPAAAAGQATALIVVAPPDFGNPFRIVTKSLLEFPG